MLFDMFAVTDLSACISDYFKPYLTLQCAWNELAPPNSRTNGNTTHSKITIVSVYVLQKMALYVKTGMLITFHSLNWTVLWPQQKSGTSQRSHAKGCKFLWVHGHFKSYHINELCSPLSNKHYANDKNCKFNLMSEWCNNINATFVNRTHWN
jgi:hypothetical protein